MPDFVDLPRWYKFRNVGILRTGVMKVEFIAPLQRPGSVTIHDIFVDEIPINLIPMVLRIPNAIFWVYLDEDQTPTEVQRNKPNEVGDYV